ncbi:MAG: hypothetical protein IAI50_05250, partial [Candidatus Eremiobacteraeota bacterium]|nr:hypothetical protein [Candidatus Eremiobacteraeota bacterium]
LVRGAVPLCIEGRDGRSKVTVVGALATAAFHLSSRSYADAVDVALPASLLYIVSGRRERLAFAIYFGAWHAPRHLALVLERDPRGGAPWQRLGRFARESMPNVAIAVAGGAIAYALRGPQSGDDDAFGALILAITVPHQLAVWWLERDAAKRGRRDRGRS